ncbi:hypothetical protein [Paenibacillus sp. Soil724D2]|uniref:hypothetical protein n=1 Tax=Paenibacillus sp. (strain Soil724D2) TaxID=1736392 RepID=UPI00071553B3|nr:hypothetical protein [Paenibacillus sp. Soil724D2]KRE49769.1 hypothetical protein ASG85_23105 [Paenibacillus sp. Soil724D2]
MKWEEKLSRWLGTQIEVHIEDQTGLDPIAPPKKMKLEKIRISEDQDFMQMYMSEHQFLAIPLRGEEHTSLISSEHGTILRSADIAAQLVYKVHFGF